MAESSPQLPDRIQRDLEEALRDGGVDKLPSRPRRPRRSFRLGMLDPRPKNPSQLVLIGVGLLVLGLITRGLGTFSGYLLLAGILCLAIAIVTHLMQPQGQKPKYWRGRYLDVPIGTWQDRLYRMIYRQR